MLVDNIYLRFCWNKKEDQLKLSLLIFPDISFPLNEKSPSTSFTKEDNNSLDFFTLFDNFK